MGFALNCVLNYDLKNTLNASKDYLNYGNRSTSNKNQNKSLKILLICCQGICKSVNYQANLIIDTQNF